MSFKRKLYSNSQGEVDLREEFDAILFGTDGGTPHNYLVLLRKMRRDSNGDLIKCSCVDELTNEPSTETECSYCLGEGYIWDEHFLRTFSEMVPSTTGLSRSVKTLPFGLVNEQYKVFYLRYSTDIDYKDKIIEMNLDKEGQLFRPYKRKRIYRPETIDFKRGDNGRIEYIAVYCSENDAIRIK